jgi:RNA polymerase sigma factor (sigma-70 family)
LKKDWQQQELVEACLQGDRRAQHALYTNYCKAMYNVCLRMVKNPADAEDMLQGAFIHVFRHLKSFRGDATLGAWIKRITINTCINFLKKRRLELTDIDDKLQQIPADDQREDGSPSLEVHRIKEAMNRLPDGYRVVFSLYLLEGYDHKEIAQILGITEATSKSQYSRAKSRLRQMITIESN